MTSRKHNFGVERKINEWRHSKNVNPPSIRLLLVFSSEIVHPLLSCSHRRRESLLELEHGIIAFLSVISHLLPSGSLGTPSRLSLFQEEGEAEG
jgi:hypothetical protein